MKAEEVIARLDWQASERSWTRRAMRSSPGLLRESQVRDLAVLRRSASIDDGVALRCEPGKDFTGGEFVMTEQRPRMQPRPMVLSLHKGDMAIIVVAQRPHKGAKGYYRVNLKHGMSRVRSGECIGLELLLHDAKPG